MSNPPKQIPKVQFIRFLRHARRILKNPLPFHHRNFQKHGDTFELDLGFGNSAIFSRDARFAQYVLQKNQKNYTKSAIQTEDLAKYVGKGLLTTEGEHWRKQRRLIQPAFHKKQLLLILDAIQAAIDHEIARVKIGEPFDVFPVFNDLAFQTVVKALFTTEIPKSTIARLQDITERAQMMLVKELRQPYKSWWFKWGGAIKKHIDLVNEAREILRTLVEERRAKKAKGDLLDMLLEARYEDGSAMSEAQLLDEILILFVAGHETTSNALTFTTELLARHPKVQEKVYAEISAAEPYTHDQMEFIKACPYTKQVIEESMRLYPPAYFIDRVNYEVDGWEGFDIPKGSNILFSIHEIHRHPDLWEQPEAFIPERFASDKAKAYSSQYYPFGAGPRMCIGNNFAMLEMVLAIASLVKKYHIDLKQTPIAFQPLITLKPKDAILVFRKRS